MSEQNFSNHTKLVPLFHFFVIPVLLLNLAQSLYFLFAGGSHAWGIFALLSALLNILVAFALLALAFLARIFALGVQDRVIRLEERLRYERLLPEDLKPRIGEFAVKQLVSLRFASDAELPVLARKVLDGKVNRRKVIKQMIQNWRPDQQRI
jgi:hypothetical protein